MTHTHAPSTALALALALALVAACGSGDPTDSGGDGPDALPTDASGTGDGGGDDVGARPDAAVDTSTPDTADDTAAPDAAPDTGADTGAPDTDAPTGPRCGDGTIDADEVCDDGNTSADDGCSPTCRLEDGVVALVINEVVAASDVSEDWIELANPNPFAVRADGWGLSDDQGRPAGDPDRPFVIAAGTLVPRGGYLVYERDAEGSFGFGFASGGDGAVLYNPRGEVADETTWTDGQAPAGSSWGRRPDVIGDFTTLAAPTRGAANE